MLERILGNASKRDKYENDQKRDQLLKLFEGIKSNQSEILDELELLRKDNAKVTLLNPLFILQSLRQLG